MAKLRAAGAMLLGLTNMPDFAASDTNRSTAFGRTGNAYDVRFCPGGSSGGTVTAVTSNLAVLGNGTDTGNSIRMPVSHQQSRGIFPTRGLVSIAGIAPLDWQLDNTGPIARDVADAAIAPHVMAGEDNSDPVTAGSTAKARPAPYTRYIKARRARGSGSRVPAFILDGDTIPYLRASAPDATPRSLRRREKDAETSLQPQTRAAFVKEEEEIEPLARQCLD